MIVGYFVNAFPTINPISNYVQGKTFWRVNHYNSLQDLKLQGGSIDDMLAGEKSEEMLLGPSS